MATATPVIWLTDRSRYQTFTGSCPREGFLGNYWGGRGVRAVAQSVPLTTGTFVHQPLAEILQFWKSHQENQTTPPETRKFYLSTILTAQQQYRALIDEKGFRLLHSDEQLQPLVEEQCALIEGLVWAWTRLVLPWILANYRIVSVEQEELDIEGCDCGLTKDLNFHLREPEPSPFEIAAAHGARGCNGVGWMSRPDFLTEALAAPGLYQYHEFKTVGEAGPAWRDSWETAMQFALGIKGAEQRLGVRIDQMYVHGLVKGRRQSEYNALTREYDGPRIQNSLACYGYRKFANPPFEEEDWQPRFKYLGADGKSHTLGKSYQKAPIWNAQLPGQRPEQSSVERWIELLSDEQIAPMITLVGPLQRQDRIIDSAMDAVVMHEHEVKQKLSVIEAEPDPLRKEQLAFMYFPPSWQCRRYGVDHRCSYEPICHGHLAEADMISSGKFELRVPHHEPEALAFGITGSEVEVETDA